nr:hypothetical protein [Tanacetum cinerariifolium]
MTLALMAKAFTLNNTTLTINNQRSSSNRSNMQITQPGINMDQDRHMLMVEDNVRNQFRPNTVQNVGNQVVQNAVQKLGIQIVENMNGLSVVLEVANQYGNENVIPTPAAGNGNGINGIQSTQEEIEFMAAADAYKETKRVKANYTLENNLQQASTSGTQSNKAPVYNSNGSAEKQQSLYNGKVLLEKHNPPAVYDSEETLKLAQHKALELEIKRLLRAVVSQDIMSVVQINYVVDTSNLQSELEHMKESFENCIIKKENEYAKLWSDWIYENAKLRAQLFDKVSKQKDTTHGTSADTKFVKQSILGKSPSSSRPKVYAVTPLPKSTAFSKVDETNALSNQVTSNSVPSSQEPNVLKNDNVISPRIFRMNPCKAYRNAKSDVVCAMCKQCLIIVNHDVCVLNYVNDMNSRALNKNANVSNVENQKKHKPKVKKPKRVGYKERLASPKPSTPRSYLRWSPTGRIFDLKGKIIATSEHVCHYDCFEVMNGNASRVKIKQLCGSTSYTLEIREPVGGTRVKHLDDYDCEIRYHPGKTNVVTDALSMKERVKPKRVRAMNMTLQSSINDRILAAQKEAGDVRTLIMDEAHKLKYSVHPGADKMYFDLRDRYWWSGMKKDITVYERIAIDFMTKLPRTSSGHDTIWVIVDRLTKSAHFLPMRADYKMDRLARLYLNEIETTKKISQIKDRLKATRDRQKSYADKRRKPLDFSVGDYVLLKVSPWKGVVRFGKKGKLPRFVRPFEIIEKISLVAYRLDLLEKLDGVHDTFYVSNLKKCLADPTL